MGSCLGRCVWYWAVGRRPFLIQGLLAARRGKRWLSERGLNALFGNWALNGVLRVRSGIPFQISSSFCKVPIQLKNFCSPALPNGASPFLQSPNDFDPTPPVLNVNSFESASSFNFYRRKR